MNSITFFICFIPVLTLILLALNLVFAPHSPYQEKSSTFECGFHSFLGQNRTQFSISFFIFGLLFLLFDLELVLVYPGAVSLYGISGLGLSILLIFFIVLTLGFVFEIGKKALEIDSRQYSPEVLPSNVYYNLIWMYNLVLISINRVHRCFHIIALICIIIPLKIVYMLFNISPASLLINYISVQLMLALIVTFTILLAIALSLLGLEESIILSICKLYRFAISLTISLVLMYITGMISDNRSIGCAIFISFIYSLSTDYENFFVFMNPNPGSGSGSWPGYGGPGGGMPPGGGGGPVAYYPSSSEVIKKGQEAEWRFPFLKDDKSLSSPRELEQKENWTRAWLADKGDLPSLGTRAEEAAFGKGDFNIPQSKGLVKALTNDQYFKRDINLSEKGLYWNLWTQIELRGNKAFLVVVNESESAQYCEQTRINLKEAICLLHPKTETYLTKMEDMGKKSCVQSFKPVLEKPEYKTNLKPRD